MNARTLSANPWVAALRNAGFRPAARGRELTRGHLRLRAGTRWSTLLSARAGSSPRPGPWKWVTTGAPRALVFDLPPLDDAHVAVIEWALATHAGRVPEQWEVPAAEDVERWTTGRLTVRVGSLTSQGKVIRTADRFAVLFPLGTVPRALGAGRRRWLDALVADAGRWRMVRIEESGAHVLEAKIDLTGVPAPALESFLETSVAALRWVVESMLRPIALVLDAEVQSAVLTSTRPSWPGSPTRGILS